MVDPDYCNGVAPLIGFSLALVFRLSGQLSILQINLLQHRYISVESCGNQVSVSIEARFLMSNLRGGIRAVVFRCVCVIPQISVLNLGVLCVPLTQDKALKPAIY